jgi:TolB-like protein
MTARRLIRAIVVAAISSAGMIVPTQTALAYEAQLHAAAAGLSRKIEAAGKSTVAVVDFTDLQMNVTELGRFLAEELQGALLAEARGYSVIDRTHLRVLLQEHKLASTGLIDPQTARKLGQVAGVRCLVTGSLTPLGDTVRMSVKAVDVDTAQVVAMLAVDIPKTETVLLLLKKTIVAVTTSAAAVNAGNSTTTAPTTASVTVVVHNVRFELLGCRREGEFIACDMRVTNLAADSDLTIYGDRNSAERTRAIDSAGVARKLIDATLGGRSLRYGSVQAWLVTNVPTLLKLTFNGTSAPSLAALYVEAAVPAPGGGFEFRDIVLRNVLIGQ